MKTKNNSIWQNLKKYQNKKLPKWKLHLKKLDNIKSKKERVILTPEDLRKHLNCWHVPQLKDNFILLEKMLSYYRDYKIKNHLKQSAESQMKFVKC